MTTQIIITLTIEGDDETEAIEIVDRLLDEGVLQDAFAEYAEDHGLDVVIVQSTNVEEIIEDDGAEETGS